MNEKVNKSEQLPNLLISQNPFVQHALAVMRDEHCPGATFREQVNKIATYLLLEAANHLSLPLHKFKGKSPEPHGGAYESNVIHSEDFGLIALMRTGMTMASSAHKLLPSALIGHAGYRYVDENNSVTAFYEAVPLLEGKYCFVFDAGIVSGNSLVALLSHMFAQRGADPKQTAVITAIASAPGVRLIDAKFPLDKIPVFAAACDTDIQVHGSKSYAVPGAGIFAQRMFGAQIADEKKFHG